MEVLYLVDAIGAEIYTKICTARHCPIPKGALSS